MGEILKRFVIVGGIGVLFVLTSALIGAGRQYGMQGPQEVGVLEYLGFKSEPSPTPETRSVDFLDEEIKLSEQKAAEQMTPSPTPDPVDSSPAPAREQEAEQDQVGTDASNDSGYYYFDEQKQEYIYYQAPRDAF